MTILPHEMEPTMLWDQMMLMGLLHSNTVITQPILEFKKAVYSCITQRHLA